MNTMHIMTSCDEGLARHIMPQLASISANMPGRRVNFYLFHYRVSKAALDQIAQYAATLRSVHFWAVTVAAKDVDILARLNKIGGDLPPEAYFSAVAHKYLPDVDRVLYIDAGDIIFHGDISGYYDCPFDGKALIATATRFRRAGGGGGATRCLGWTTTWTTTRTSPTRRLPAASLTPAVL